MYIPCVDPSNSNELDKRPTCLYVQAFLVSMLKIHNLKPVITYISFNINTVKSDQFNFTNEIKNDTGYWSIIFPV